MEKNIKEECKDFPGFVDLRSCILHTVHKAFGKGLHKLLVDIDQMCVDVHALFKHSAARREDYEKLQYKFDVEIHQFQQHTEVRWLSFGPAIIRLLEQWDVLLQFVKDLAKKPKTAPRSVNYRRVAAMLAPGEKETTKAHLEFLKNVIHIFEEFLTLFQRSTPTIHLVYDMMCRTLIKLMCRFLKSDTVKSKWRSDLPKLPCDHVGEQLNDADVAIGDRARGILRLLKKDKERGFVLGVRAFFCAAITHLQCKLLLQNNLLQDLGYLHPKQLERRRTQSSIQNVARNFQP